MASCRVPGPTCLTTAEPIDSGTLVLWVSAPPGVINGSTQFGSSGVESLTFAAKTSGRGQKATSLKQHLANGVTAAAELAHQYYEQASSFSAENPWLTESANEMLHLIRPLLSDVVDVDPKTMGWTDLGAIWLFQLGGTSEWEFTADARTTKDMMKEEGVDEARQLATTQLKQMVATGCHPPMGRLKKPHPWTYGQKQFYQGLRTFDLATSFTGSYIVDVFIDCPKQLLTFKVSNNTGWESGTRLRKAAKPGGIHQGIVPDRKRADPGVELGGNIEQIWSWEEHVDLSAK